MVDRVGDVVRAEPQIERMQHAARDRDSEIGFEMAFMVPAEGSHAVSPPQSESLQGERELARAAGHVAVAVAMERAVGATRDDLAVEEEGFSAPEHHGNRQRVVHHQTVHGRDPFISTTAMT